MPEFNLNGKSYNIPDNFVDQFLIDNPTAEKIEEVGKLTPSQEVKSKNIFVIKLFQKELKRKSLLKNNYKIHLLLMKSISFLQWVKYTQKTKIGLGRLKN